MRNELTVPPNWQDWGSFALGLWLGLSPWLLGYSEHHAATANAAFTGVALALASHFEVTFDLCAEWLNLAAGLWLIAAPFVLGFPSVRRAALTSLAVGALVALLAASALAVERRRERIDAR